MAGASGKKLDETYKLAWLRGLKTTYYLRTVGATHAEKSTVKSGQLNAVSSGSAAGAASAMGMAAPASAGAAMETQDEVGDVKFCAIDNPDCEACQ
jgi:ribonucleoside-diphosphate reductase alpha chain